MWWLYIIKSIACLFGVFTTVLFLNSLVSSMFRATNSFNDDNEAETRNASIRIILGMIMSVCWTIVIVF